MSDVLLPRLIAELPALGGWPEWAHECVIHNGAKRVMFYDEDERFSHQPKFPQIEIDKESDVEISVSREAYETALASRNPKWDGDGLPPVGCRVEVKADDFEGGWLVIDVVYVHNGEVAGIVQSDNEYLNDRLEKFSAGYNRAEFRPIRSEEDRRRDEATQSILDILNDYDFELVHIRSDQRRIATDIVERITTGIVPHIRID